MKPQSNLRPNAQRAGTVALRVIALLLLVSAASGCLNEIVGIGYLIGGPPTIEPKFNKATKKSFTDYGVKVAIVCLAPNEVKHSFHNVDNELAQYVSHRLSEHHIQVFTPDQIRNWLDRNGEWDEPEEIGAAFNATYVVFIDVQSFRLFEKNSANLLRGQAEVKVRVIEMEPDGEGETIFSEEINSRYPLAIPRPASETNPETFRREYLSRLSDEIGRLFYEYANGDDFNKTT